MPVGLPGGVHYLASKRVRIALQGHAPIAAAVQAVHATMKALRDGTPPGKLTGIAPPELMTKNSASTPAAS